MTYFSCCWWFVVVVVVVVVVVLFFCCWFCCSCYLCYFLVWYFVCFMYCCWCQLCLCSVPCLFFLILLHLGCILSFFVRWYFLSLPADISLFQHMCVCSLFKFLLFYVGFCFSFGLWVLFYSFGEGVLVLIVGRLGVPFFGWWFLFFLFFLCLGLLLDRKKWPFFQELQGFCVICSGFHMYFTANIWGEIWLTFPLRHFLVCGFLLTYVSKLILLHILSKRFKFGNPIISVCALFSRSWCFGYFLMQFSFFSFHCCSICLLSPLFAFRSLLAF